jgi:hypothetical protein
MNTGTIALAFRFSSWLNAFAMEFLCISCLVFSFLPAPPELVECFFTNISFGSDKLA